MPEAISASIRAELDQTPEWWDRQFTALVRKQIPSDAAFHAGHDVVGPVRSMGGTIVVGERCVGCGVTIERPPDG